MATHLQKIPWSLRRELQIGAVLWGWLFRPKTCVLSARQGTFLGMEKITSFPNESWSGSSKKCFIWPPESQAARLPDKCPPLAACIRAVRPMQLGHQNTKAEAAVKHQHASTDFCCHVILWEPLAVSTKIIYFYLLWKFLQLVCFCMFWGGVLQYSSIMKYNHTRSGVAASLLHFVVGVAVLAQDELLLSQHGNNSCQHLLDQPTCCSKSQKHRGHQWTKIQPRPLRTRPLWRQSFRFSDVEGHI